MESAVLCIISMILAFIIISCLYQWFQTSMGLKLPALTELPFILYIIPLVLMIIVALAGGLYPALYLSSLKPGKLFATSLKSGGRGVLIRRILMLIQFIISIFLTIQSITIFRQYMYMKNTDPGLDIDRIIQFEIPAYLADRSDAIRDALTDNPDIEAVSFSGQPLGSIKNTNTFRSPLNDARIPFKVQLIDPEHRKVLGLEMLSGEFFDRDMQGDKELSVVINETGARAMGYDPPEKITGLLWTVDGADFTVIGVVKDYHFNSLETSLQPGLLVWREGMMKVSLRFNPDKIPEVINHIKKVWHSFEPDKPLNYSFLDENYNSHYEGEQKLLRLISIFTIIAMIIACFGVYGISAFMARRLAKNISLRKVMGANTITVIEHFAKEYLLLIIIAGAISIPLGYIYILKWLERFPYKTNISAWIFIAAFLLNLFVVICTIIYHAYKTARLNPANVLRYE
jgi:putative ABC transport system permease protein